MLRFHKSLDVITLFHNAKQPSSLRALALLKQTSATASETATEDQAGDHSQQNQRQRTEFELNVTEDAPTSDQLRSIFEYVGAPKAGEIVKGARDEADAMKKLKESADNFQRPIVSGMPHQPNPDLDILCRERSLIQRFVLLEQIVDWNNGRAVVGANESEILKMINTLPKQDP
ncbi:MAG: hypothetical protein M1825_002584 [Sarcosagium campestre]|nr:MAG: hypothetical protein M1825_002584 [Sarcosagium campestre]